MSQLTQHGIAALKSGDRVTARKLLSDAVRQDPNDAQAWLWLSGSVAGEAEREACLRNVLRIDPNNQAAQRGLQQIAQRKSQPATAQPPARPADPPPVAGAAVPAYQPAINPVARLPFKTRPSQVPVLFTFWLFFVGAVGIGYLLKSQPQMAWTVAGGLGLLLELFVIYAAIRNSRTRYEFDGRQLILPFRGKRSSILVEHIYLVEAKKNLLQRVLQTGDIWINGAIRGELINLRLRNIPECDRRAEQLQAILREQTARQGR